MRNDIASTLTGGHLTAPFGITYLGKSTQPNRRTSPWRLIYKRCLSTWREPLKIVQASKIVQEIKQCEMSFGNYNSFGTTNYKDYIPWRRAQSHLRLLHLRCKTQSYFLISSYITLLIQLNYISQQNEIT